MNQDPQADEKRSSSLFETIHDFLESGERLASVLASIALAGLFFALSFTELGAEAGPWYFWVSSGLIALVVSVLLAWVFFPPERKKGSRAPDEAIRKSFVRSRGEW